MQLKIFTGEFPNV